MHLFKGDIQQTLGEGTCMEHLTVTACYVANFLVIYDASGQYFSADGLAWWFGARWFGYLRSPLMKGIGLLRGSARFESQTTNPNHRFNHQLNFQRYLGITAARRLNRRTLYLTEKTSRPRVPVMQGSFQRP